MRTEKNYFKPSTGIRKILFLLMAAALSAASLSSCSNDDDGDGGASGELFEYLQGTWESTHIEEHDHLLTYKNGVFAYNQADDTDRDIRSKEDEFYCKMKFDRKSMLTILEVGQPEEDDPELPISARFTVSGDKLYCPLMYGDYTKYWTVYKIDDDEMILELIDNGVESVRQEPMYDDEGTYIGEQEVVDYQKYTERITFKKANVLSLIVKDKWVSTHVEIHDYVNKDGTLHMSDTNRGIGSKSDKFYMEMRFSNDSLLTILYANRFDGLKLPATEKFTLDGNKLSCPLLYGKFTDYVTIEIVNDNEMILELVDNGTDEDGKHEYTERVTYKRYQTHLITD